MNRSWILLLSFYLSAVGADKSGVSPNTISLPKGPGSIEGLGDSFQPTLNTGTAKYGLGIKVPAGTAGQQPSLALAYEGGGGNGPLGYGWSVSLPHIQRRTDKGMPTYGQALGVQRPDTFITESREELVPTSDGYFFCENESSFVRYRQVGDYWEATAPDGTRLEFGITAAGRIEETGRVFTWLLERETDTRGNVVEYVYRAFPGAQNLNQKYLSLVRYGPAPPPWTAFHFVAFEYEDRPDWFEDGRAGFLVRTGKRLRSIRVATQGVPLTNHLSGDFNGDDIADYLDRRYDLDYLRYDGASSHWSLLARVTLVGADGITTLPPATFNYAVSNPPEIIDASSNVWTMLNVPNAVMDNPLADLIDLNADGLPDVLKTESGGGGHTVAVNRGPVRQGETWFIQWANPASVDPGAGTAWNFDLASDQTHLADMDGDGLADLVHKTADETVFYFLNRGRVAWGERRDMALQESAPPAPFGNPRVRTADVDFDKRIDIIQSIDFGGGIGYRVWFNLGAQSYSPPATVEPEGGFDFGLEGVQIADCNGDRVPDIARIQAGGVNVAAGLGYGRFAAALSLVLPDMTLDNQQIGSAKLTDINGDGLADLVLERAVPGQGWFWLNLGNYTFSSRRIITGLPAVSVHAAVRWADLNGNGTTDLVYSDSTAESRLQMVELGQLLSGGLPPNLLTRIGNGLGRTTTIEYAPSTRFALEDEAADRPWPDSLPFPVTVVKSVVVSDSLGHEYITHYRYHDGYYDPVEKQFRGFAEVEQVEVGDATAPTLVSRSHFDTGRAFDAMKGRLLRASRETEDGAVFSLETTTWADPPRALRTGTNGLIVRFAHPVAGAKQILERGVGTPRRLESEMQYDDYGNVTRLSDYGIVEEGNRSAFNDERVTVTEFALNTLHWIVRAPRRQAVQDENGVAISLSEYFFDDETFSGNNLGRVTIGNLTMRRDWIDPASPTNFVNSVRTRYDSFGNPVLILDPLADASANPASGHVRELTYDDDFHTYAERETIHIGGGSDALIFRAEYDQGLGTVNRSIDFNSHTTTYGYDALARLIRIIRPGDTEEHPTTECEYVLGLTLPRPHGGAGQTEGVINYVETRQRDVSAIQNPKSAMYLHSRQFSDGLGRALMTRTEAEPAEGGSASRVVVSGVALFNARLKASRALHPFFTKRAGTLAELLAFEDVEAPGWEGQFAEGAGLVTLNLATAHQASTEYDATLRAVKRINPGGTVARIEFEPLLTRSFDENDNDPASEHFGTPMENFADGLGRLIQANELVRLNDDGTPSGTLNTWTTRYQYDLNDQLTRITDSQDNVKELRYDGLKRKIWMNDPDTGISTNTFDAASNLRETVDAKNQRISYTYDGANRILTEDYHDENSPEFSYHRSTDVTYHYDKPAGLVDQGDGTRTAAQNTKGNIAYVEDTTGEEHTSYDARGRVEWTVKRIPDPVLTSRFTNYASLTSYKTAFEYDSADRVTRLIYADNDEVSYHYNARSLLERIVGGPSGSIISAVSYLPSAQQERLQYGNGVQTTWEYDQRLRLKRLLTRDATRNTELIHFAYSFDGVSNIKNLIDQRPGSTVLATDRRRNSQAFAYDDLYRLTRVQYNLPNPATANGGHINYRYDRIGNMLAQTSDIAHEEDGISVTDLGTMDYGGTAGRSSRMGRQPADPPGPHALSQIRNSTYTYDASGNMTLVDGRKCVWDFKDRLVAVENGNLRAEYRSDYTGRRGIKQVFWKHDESTNRATSTKSLPSASWVLYPGKQFEVREHDQPTKYVFNGGTRVARITGSLSPNRRIQRFRLHAGWNLLSLAVTAEDLAGQLQQGEFGQVPVVGAAYLWNEETGGYSLIASGQTVSGGAVLWVKANTNAALAISGTYSEPTHRQIMPGGTYIAAAGLEAWCPSFPPDLAAWRFASDDRRWFSRLNADLAFVDDFPQVLAPGEAFYVSTGTPAELEVPPSTLRIRYYHQDHLGSSSVITDADGALVEEAGFYPYGIPRHEYRVRPVNEPYKFTQKERDQETGLHYFEARFLAGTLSRFLSPDPVSANPDSLSSGDFSGFLANPQKLNIYSYAVNRPTSFVDPSGFWELDYGAEGAPDMHEITGVFDDPEAERLGEVFAGFGKAGAGLVLDVVNGVLGTSPANAPDRGTPTYESVGPLEHMKDVALTFGGPKFVSWAGGKVIGWARGTAGSVTGGAPIAPGPPPVIANTAALGDTAAVGAPAVGRSMGATAATTQKGRSLIAVAETQLPGNAVTEAARQVQLARKMEYIHRRIAETAAERAAAMELFNRGYSVRGAGHIIKMIGDEANAIFGALNLAE